VETARDETADRLATTLGRIAGVASVLVCTREGALIGAAGDAAPGREPFLAAFVSRRAAALGDGDLRGWGARLVQGRLEKIVLSGARREAALYSYQDNIVWFALAPGASAEALGPTIQQSLQRFR